jgi:hypothetical protein
MILLTSPMYLDEIIIKIDIFIAFNTVCRSLTLAVLSGSSSHGRFQHSKLRTELADLEPQEEGDPKRVLRRDESWSVSL